MNELLPPPAAILAEAQILMSIAKPIMLVAIFVPYMRFVAKFEADARRFTLPVAKINAVLIGVAILSLIACILIPIFWIGWVLALGMMVGTMYGYWKYRDPRVPEGERFKLGGEGFAKAMEARGEGVVLDQFSNPANPAAHFNGTGPEIWAQSGGRITHFVTSMGTTGTAMGTSRCVWRTARVLTSVC